MSDIGGKIAQLRKKKDLSQTDFAKAIGASRTIKLEGLLRNEKKPF